MCSLIIIFEDLVELPATKVFEDILGWAIAQNDRGLIEGSIERANFSDIGFKVGDKTTIYGIRRLEGNPCAVDSIVTHI